jgi:23S rRNA (cytidine1920-2'-O)/16S rRNA (cytidine1409-2'-O)-methyltransferase
MKKVRLDILLTERGLAESRSQAQRLIMAGQVRVGDQLADKSGFLVSREAEISIDQGPQYVSRGGEKLEAALHFFGLNNLDGMICADAGSSTGGFTDCLLQHGAARVYAIDVGYGILHWKLRNDDRVVSIERTNARYVTSLPEPVNLVTVDVSFISLKILFPVIRNWYGTPGGLLITLIKPQFEAGRSEAARGEGVIRDPNIHKKVLREIVNSAQKEGYGLIGLVRSTLVGPKGNVEFLGYFQFPGDVHEHTDQKIDGMF